jgi:3-oxoacyl-[acyl-carrier-protein] synthase III
VDHRGAGIGREGNPQRTELTMTCYLTATGMFLPGDPVVNDQIKDFLGALEGEAGVAAGVLAMNGIERRHYALDRLQRPTCDVYDLATRAAQACLADAAPRATPSYLSVGTTYAPYSGPGIASIVHDRLRRAGVIDHPLEISSHGGICTSSAAALVAAIRSVQVGDHATALAIGAEHASEVLKSTAIQPVDDRAAHADVRRSQWFMSVFLRFMLSDGAGAVLLEREPCPDRLSLRVDWSHSASFAHEAPLCMRLDNTTRLLSQNVDILNRHLFTLADRFVGIALEAHGERLDRYRVVLPHMSSYFFRRKMERMIQRHTGDAARHIPYWTNLRTVGNTGAASIYIMVHQFLEAHQLADGDRLLLFVPESGQFNFVLISLTAVSA